MATVQEGMFVRFSYVLTLDDGEIIDESPVGEPLGYVHGTGSIISGLEKALEGMAVGDEKDVLVPAAEAYGEFEPGMIEALPRSLFPSDVEIGMGFRMRNQEGQVLTVFVESISDDVVEVNLSHPLAGKDLHFAVQIAEVRQATEEDLMQGSCGCGCGDDCDDDCDCCN